MRDIVHLLHTIEDREYVVTFERLQIPNSTTYRLERIGKVVGSPSMEDARPFPFWLWNAEGLTPSVLAGLESVAYAVARQVDQIERAEKLGRRLEGAAEKQSQYGRDAEGESGRIT